MTVYWLLFGFAALLALVSPTGETNVQRAGGRSLGLVLFFLLYTAMGALRYEVGGDWLNYQDIFEDVSHGTMGEALSKADPLYFLLNWVSAQLGTGIYLVNGVCCAMLAYGTIAVAARMREPWLALTIAVPYLWIVVGFGYVRQGAAIGMILVALSSVDRSRPFRTMAYLVIGAGFHGSAAVAFPLFAWALAKRNKALILVLAIVGSAAFLALLAPRLDTFQTNYIEAEYDSSGAAVRVLMGLVPAVLVLLRWRRFPASDRVRSVWLLIAIANVVAFVALGVSSSSTAVDRLALFVSVIQIAAYGEIRALTGASGQTMPVIRLALIGLAAAVQTVWLVYATNAPYWVPYSSILQFL